MGTTTFFGQAVLRVTHFFLSYIRDMQASPVGRVVPG